MESILVTLANTLDGLTEPQQKEVSRGLGLAAGSAVKGTKNKVDDAVFLNVVLPNLRTLLDAAEEALTAPAPVDNDTLTA